MNIIYIHTHDTGRYTQPYGYGVDTPHLMKFANEGTLFRNAYCAGPTCSPSRAGLLTGMAPHSCGMLGLSHRGFELNDYSKHLVQFLNQLGYETTLCGVQHEARREELIGYKRILHKEQYTLDNFKQWDMTNANLAADYIRESKEKPFFLSFGMVNTHRPFKQIDEDVNPDYVIPPFPILDNDVNRKDMAAYYSSVRVVDHCVGIVMKAIEEMGIRDNTLIIFTTDHGIAFPRMKCNLYDTGIGVSLIMDFPHNKKKGNAIDALVSHLDIYPTICELLDVGSPDWIQGESMLPLFTGEQAEIRHNIFSEVNFHASYDPMRCVRTERYKLIKIFSTHGRFVHLGGDGGIAEKFIIQHGGYDFKRDEEMLFDLYLDPLERVNYVKEESYQSIYKKLSEDLEKWMIATDDPLIHGDVLPPEGARIVTLNHRNPNIVV